ncbi:MAG TPA: trigger factor [Bacteroidota bacterium]|nr:trigger factor [Bacteroidota bacterium]
MEVSITDISEVEKEMHIQTSAEELIPHFEEAYKRYQPKIELHGFRKGKAPLDLVKKIYGESIEYSSLDTIASDVYRGIVEERNLQPIGEPVLTDLDYKRGTGLTFKVKYEIKPNVVVQEYRNLPVEKLVHTITDKEVQDEIYRLRKANATLEEVQQVTDDDHLVTADIQQLDAGGSPLIGKKTPDAKLYLADDTLYPEIRDALRTGSTGASLRVKVDHTHDKEQHTDYLELAVKKIEKTNLPVLDDEFVKKITKGRTVSVDAFMQQLRQDLEQYWKDRSEQRLSDTIIGEIVKRHPLTVPESLVKGVLDSLIEDLRNRYPKKKFPPDFNEQAFRESNRNYAVFQAQWYLLRESIINKEGITAGEADLRKRADQDAPNVGIDKDRLYQFYETSAQVKDRIVSEKLMEFLTTHQSITEKVTEEAF